MIIDYPAFFFSSSDSGASGAQKDDGVDVGLVPTGDGRDGWAFGMPTAWGGRRVPTMGYMERDDDEKECRARWET
jgi:hypothetical protein